jgi:hypothetical protein
VLSPGVVCLESDSGVKPVKENDYRIGGSHFVTCEIYAFSSREVEHSTIPFSLLGTVAVRFEFGLGSRSG